MAQSLFARIYSNESTEDILVSLKAKQASSETVRDILQLCIHLTGFQHELSVESAQDSSTYPKVIQVAIDAKTYSAKNFLLQETNGRLMANVQAFFVGALPQLEVGVLDSIGYFVLAMMFSEENDFKMVGSFLRIVCLHGLIDKLIGADAEVLKIEEEIVKRRLRDAMDVFLEQLMETMQQKLTERVSLNQLIDDMATHFDIKLMYTDSCVPIVERFCDLLNRHFDFLIRPERNFLKQLPAIFARNNAKCLMVVMKGLQKLIRIDEEEVREQLLEFCLKDGNQLLYSMLFVNKHRMLIIESFRLINMVQARLRSGKLLFDSKKIEKLYIKVFSESRIMRELVAEFIYTTAKVSSKKTALGVFTYLVTSYDVPNEMMKKAVETLMICPSFTQWDNYIALLESTSCPIESSLIIDILCIVIDAMNKRNDADSPAKLTEFVNSYSPFLLRLRKNPLAYQSLLGVFMTIDEKLLREPPTGGNAVFCGIIEEIHEAFSTGLDFFAAKRMASCLNRFKLIRTDVELNLEDLLTRAFEDFMNDAEGDDAEELRELALIQLTAILSIYNHETLSDEQLGQILSRIEPNLTKKDNKIVYLSLAGHAAYYQLYSNLLKFNPSRLIECYTQNMTIAKHLLKVLRGMRRKKLAYDQEIAYSLFNILCLLAETFNSKMLLRSDIRLPADIFYPNLLEMSKFVVFVLQKPSSTPFLTRYTTLFANHELIPRLSCAHLVLKHAGNRAEYTGPLGTLLATLLRCAERKHGNAKSFCVTLAHALTAMNCERRPKRVESFVSAILSVLGSRDPSLFGELIVATVRTLMDELKPIVKPKDELKPIVKPKDELKPADEAAVKDENRLQLLDFIWPIAKKAAGDHAVFAEVAAIFRRSAQRGQRAEKKSLTAFLDTLKGNKRRANKENVECGVQMKRRRVSTI